MNKKKKIISLLLCMSCFVLEGSAGADILSRPNKPKLAENEMAAQVKQFVAFLASQDCEARSRAIYDELPKLKAIPHQIFLNQSGFASRTVKSKVVNLLKALEQEEKSGKEFEVLVKAWIAPALKAEGADKVNRFALAKEKLLAIAKSKPAPKFRRAAAVGTMEFFVGQYDDPDGEARRLGLPLVEWKSALTALLKSEDVGLRSLVAGMLGQSSAFGDEGASNILPILLLSLRDDDLSSRILSQKALMHLTKQNFCIDPTDSLDMREAGIQQWETWWNQAVVK